MTRAKTYLIMTSRKEVMKFYGQGIKVDRAERSRFLDALVSKKSQKKSGTQEAEPRSSRGKPLGEHATKRGRSAQSVSNADGSGRSSRQNSGNLDRLSRKDWKYATGAGRAGSTNNAALRSVQGTSRNGWGVPSDRARKGTTPKTQNRMKGSPTNNDRENRDAPPEFDSTLFFPIGSPVIHAIHGTGKVITPSSSSNEPMMVNVRFKDGMELPFPINDIKLCS